MRLTLSSAQGRIWKGLLTMMHIGNVTNTSFSRTSSLIRAVRKKLRLLVISVAIAVIGPTGDKTMAETQQTAVVSNPWESDWGSGTSFLSPQKPVAGSRTPWEDDWSNGTSYLPNAVVGASSAPSGDGYFDQIVKNMIQAESRGRHRDASGKLTTSPVGAQGITQVMPGTGTDPGFGVRPLQNDSEEEYVRFGRDYLSAMLQKYNGDYELALAAYNAGPGNVDKAVQRGGAEWKTFLPKRKETIPYIDKILGGMNG